MKTLIIFLLVTIASMILAQTQNNFSPGFRASLTQPGYDRKVPPPLTLDAAYGKALLEMGTATNQYHCIGATCLPRLMTLGTNDGHVYFGWTFEFSDTNGISKKVDVYFDRTGTARIEEPVHF